jgi:hypothetical protein
VGAKLGVFAEKSSRELSVDPDLKAMLTVRVREGDNAVPCLGIGLVLGFYGVRAFGFLKESYVDTFR